MPSNDTENIYATQYGGEGEPIPANKISYDGTGTSIEAETVQDAITEIDTDLQSTKEVLENGYMLVETNKQISVTADGVKTLGALMTELGAACLTAIQALTDKEVLIPRSFSDSNKTFANIGMTAYTNEDVSFNPTFQRIDATASATNLYYAKVPATGAGVCIYTTLEATPATTITNKAEEVVAADKVLSVSFYKFEKA